PGHARRLDLRPRPDRVLRGRIRDRAPRGVWRDQRQRRCEPVNPIELPMAPPAPATRLVTLTIDDQSVEVPEGSTILDACRKLGIDTPTLCYGETLMPANACRICVVELEGARTGARLLAQGRAGHEDPHRLRA